jgi:aarF domain-containing kinase
MYVPRTFPTLCTPQVLVTEFVEGYPIDHAATLPQEVRDAVARTILVATVRELFEWRFVQSDPNFSNFLYDPRVCIIHCVDFGAARDYPKPFVDDYIELVWAAANNDSKKLMEVSKTLGFLSGDFMRNTININII